MGVKKELLYGTYRLLKKTGYFERAHKTFTDANILLFHRVNDLCGDSISTSTDLFKKLMKEIKHNFKPTPLRTVVEKIKTLQPLDPKTVVITFDDDYEDMFTNAVPILVKYDIPATFFITSGYINTDRTYPWDAENECKSPLMRWEHVNELVKLGFEIGAHTVNHFNLGKTPFEITREEMIRSKKEIEDTIQKEVRSFAYPFGSKDSIAQRGPEIAKEAGYECCCSVYGGKVNEHSDPYSLYRIGAYPNFIEFLMELDNFMTYFDGRMSINLFGNKGKIVLGG